LNLHEGHEICLSKTYLFMSLVDFHYSWQQCKTLLWVKMAGEQSYIMSLLCPM